LTATPSAPERELEENNQACTARGTQIHDDNTAPGRPHRHDCGRTRRAGRRTHHLHAEHINDLHSQPPTVYKNPDRNTFARSNYMTDHDGTDTTCAATHDNISKLGNRHVSMRPENLDSRHATNYNR
jgi:hypothetical protein